jgi:hypothetical protein
MEQKLKRAIIRELEQEEKRIVTNVAEEMGKTVGSTRRILFGRKNGKTKWKVLDN